MPKFISIAVAVGDYDKVVARKWYRTAIESLPNGVAISFATGEGNTSVMKRSKEEDKIVLTIPLSRNLTTKEVEKVKGCFSAVYRKSFALDSSKIVVDTSDLFNAVEPEPLIDLCTAWAKRQHDQWMKEKLAAGWRYGSAVSLDKKTHPLLRQWIDLPDKYRVVDTTQAEELLSVFAEQGYMMISKLDLDQLSGS